MKAFPGLFVAAAGAALNPFATEILADSPVLYWKLDETSGTVAADASGHSATGTISGTPTLGDTPLFGGSVHSFKTTTAGAGKVTSTTDPLGSNYDGSITMVVGFKLADLAQLQCLLGRGNSTGWNVIGAIGTDGGILAEIVTTSTGSNTVVNASTAAGVITAGVTHLMHLIWRSAVQLELWIDGVLLITAASTTHALRESNTDTPNNSLTLGWLQTITGSYAGNIDEFAVYNTALSAGRVAVHYASRNT